PEGKDRPVFGDTVTQIPIRRALISVYDKTGLEELASGLHAAGVEIVSTGNSAARVAAAGVTVTPVEELTGFPECLDGRVKTLHPKVHAGILADLRKPDHEQQLADVGVQPFDLVVVNLYPFVETVAGGATPDECVEQIDIGGPSMVRAAAKNHPSVAVVVDPASYGDVRAALSDGGFTLEQRQALAAKAFQHTASYDIAVGVDIAEAHRLAHACDPLSAYGGVIAANRAITKELAEQLSGVLTEVICAPDFDDDALEIFKGKNKLRVLKSAADAHPDAVE